jgi:ATP-dependent Clp protease adaptor protein ClpS
MQNQTEAGAALAYSDKNELAGWFVSFTHSAPAKEMRLVHSRAPAMFSAVMINSTVPLFQAPMRLAGDDDNGRDDRDNDGGSKTGLVTKTRPKTKKPSLYRVLLLNDDYTPMEFVTHVLQKYFNKSREEAERIMLHVHQKGVGVCGVFTYEVAETKVTQVMDFSRKNSHPLQCTMEKE